MPTFPFRFPSPVLEQGHLSVPSRSPGHNGVQGMVGPKAVQPPTASQPRPAHGVPDGERASGLGWHQGPSVHPVTPIKALYHFPKSPTTALHLFWGAGFFLPGGNSPEDYPIIPAPPLALGKREEDGCTQAPPDSPPPPCFAYSRAPQLPQSPSAPMADALTAAAHPARHRGRGSSAGRSAHPWCCS